MQASPWLFEILKAREPFRPTAYRSCRHAGWVVGYGSPASAGDTCTLEQAEAMLRDDIARHAATISAAMPNLPQDEFNILVALAVACR